MKTEPHLTGAEEIEGLGRRGDRVHVTLERPIGTYSLLPEETLALSRIVGEPTLDVALRATGFPAPKAADLLRGLRSKGILRIGDAPAPRPDGLPDDEPGVQLSPEERAEIRRMAALLPTGKHWELLGVRRMATTAEVKEAYFELSRRFHPDRFWGRELGSYRRAIEAIFMQLKEAEATLSDPERRAAYLAANPEKRTAAQREQDEVTARRRAERSARLRRTNPLLQRAHVAAELASQARRLASDGKYAEASATFAAAAAKHGRSDELLKAAEDAAARARRDRAQKALRAAKAAQAAGDVAAAHERYLEAAETADDPAISVEAIGAFLDSGGDPARVRSLVSGLVVSASSNAGVHALHGRLLLAAGLEKAGQAALERALRLDPNEPFATSLKRKPRWPF
ncbi:MAG TPA: J domain-containing protein [Vulgatibacter sp.]|nr:J domain-containing protein [Vulgatibacter sp.]